MSGPLMPCLETICMVFYNDVHLHIIFFYLITSKLWCFYKSSYLLHYLTLVYDDDQLQKLLVCCLSVCFSSVLPLHSNQNLPCALWHLMISVFLVILLSTEPPYLTFSCLLQNLMLEYLHYSHCQIPVW